MVVRWYLIVLEQLHVLLPNRTLMVYGAALILLQLVGDGLDAAIPKVLAITCSIATLATTTLFVQIPRTNSGELAQ